jgi:hypothetical protein
VKFTARLGLVVAAAILAGPLFAAPAAHAERAFVCQWGTHFLSTTTGTMSILANPCTGPDGTGPGTVTLLSGVLDPPATFSCQRIAMVGDFLVAGSC